jgi:hypothetical protein
MNIFAHDAFFVLPTNNTSYLKSEKKVNFTKTKKLTDKKNNSAYLN